MRIEDFCAPYGSFRRVAAWCGGWSGLGGGLCAAGIARIGFSQSLTGDGEAGQALNAVANNRRDGGAVESGPGALRLEFESRVNQKETPTIQQHTTADCSPHRMRHREFT